MGKICTHKYTHTHSHAHIYYTYTLAHTHQHSSLGATHVHRSQVPVSPVGSAALLQRPKQRDRNGPRPRLAARPVPEALRPSGNSAASFGVRRRPPPPPRPFPARGASSALNIGTRSNLTHPCAARRPVWWEPKGGGHEGRECRAARVAHVARAARRPPARA